jgi:hypothetical protein
VPKAREHIARSRQNLKFAQSFNLKETPYIDWVVTAYFYAALHLVDALIADRYNLTPQDHMDRNLFVEKTFLAGIKVQYRTLKDLSEDARYELKTFTSVRVENEVIPLYNTIARHIERQLNL